MNMFKHNQIPWCGQQQSSWCLSSISESGNTWWVLCCWCCCSVAKLYPTLCDPICSMPGSPVLRCLPEFAQIHVHWVGDATKPSHPLPPPSPFAFSLSQHQGSVEASASVLPMNIQGWFPLRLTGLMSRGLSRVFSSIIVQKHQFFGTQPSLWSNFHIHTLLEKP